MSCILQIFSIFFYRFGIAKPGWTTELLRRALKGSSLIVTAWEGTRLIGFSNFILDFAWIAYLSQLAVDPEFQGKGIGKKLIDLILCELGDEITLVVHSADAASGFYQHVGFEPYSNFLRISRKR